MRDADRFKLRYGPYECPACSVGDKVLCEFRDRDVIVGGMTDAPIQWPYRKGPGRPGRILFGDLIRAVESEAEIAVAHHWGVSKKTVWAWRKALEVPRMTKGGTQLAIAYAPERLNEEARTIGRRAMGRADVRARLSEAKVGKPLHPHMISAQRGAVGNPKTEEWKQAASERMRKVWEHPEQHGLPARHRWTDEEIALLGTDHDPVIAERLGVAPHVVEQKRRRLGIPGIVDRWSPAEIGLLGTAKDREIAERLRKTTAAVRRKRELLGIPPHVARWSDAEIALLGTDTDRAVAETLGRTASAVETKRMSLGIRSSRSRKRT